MKPAKGDIWVIKDILASYHFLFIDDGYAHPWEHYIIYNVIHLESGELDTVFFTEDAGFAKVA